MEFAQNVPLAPLTTLGIGGPARWLATPTTEAELLAAVAWARQRELPLFVLGGGSNLLVADSGFPGLVLRIALKGLEIQTEQDAHLYRVAAGELWDPFVQRAVEDNCAGIECLAGIPGSVGGTPVQNVGAYGQEVADTIVSVRVLDLESLQFREMLSAQCGFAYRSSLFNTAARGRYLVTRADYRLTPGGPAHLRYADLKNAFPPSATPTLLQVAETVRRIRQSKGMLLVPGDPDCRSAGSFFKNPIVSAGEFAALAERLAIAPPQYPAGPGTVKLPAAWLIEQAGFAKGFSLGPVAISSRHTLALVNLGAATAAEMLALRDRIAEQVEEKFGIALEMEPVLVGF